MRRALRIAALAALGAAAAAAAGASSPALPIKGAVSVPMQIVVLLTLLTLLPAALVSVTPFLRTLIVLHFLRQAMGTQSTPSNQVLLGLGMFLTLLIMHPVLSDIRRDAWVPFERGEVGMEEAAQRAAVPLRAFWARFAREKDVRFFLEVAKAPAPRTPADLELRVLVPAYILSEMKAGFQIGAVLFLPFLVIDLVVASVTLSVGMIQLPPAMISAPFKILLFVLVDGWNLVVGSLVKSFYVS